MFKRLMMVALVFSGTIAYSAEVPQAAIPRVVVAWDLHSVLFHRTFPLFRQYEVKPSVKTFKIVKELAKKGIEQHILSNINDYALERVIQKYPEFFTYFDLEKSQVKTDGIEKPQELYYLNYLNKNNIDPSKTLVLFIDDRKQNVTGAEKTGIIGIHFKNPKQLREALIAVGIL